MINLLLTVFSLLLIIPSIIGLCMTITTRGIRGVTMGLWSVLTLVGRLGKYLIIPLASFILLAPDSWKLIVPNSSTTVGIAVLIVASLVLLLEMFKGLGSALAISFWAALCLIIVGAFHLDRLLPKDIPLALGSVEKQIASLGKHVPDRSVPAPAKSRKVEEDGLEYSAFALDRPVIAERVATNDSFAWPDIGLNHLESAVKDNLTPSLDAFGLGYDQSISGLPSSAYFNPQSKKRQYFGLSSSETDSSSFSLSSLAAFDPTHGLLSKFLEK